MNQLALQRMHTQCLVAPYPGSLGELVAALPVKKSNQVRGMLKRPLAVRRDGVAGRRKILTADYTDRRRYSFKYLYLRVLRIFWLRFSRLGKPESIG